MDIRKYDLAFVEKLGATPVAGRGYFLQDVPGLVRRDGSALPVPVLFDLPEEWWDERDVYGVELAPGERVVCGINVKRMDIVMDPSRFLPNFKARELSSNPDTPNTWNIQKHQSIPVTILYNVQLVTESQVHMNKLLEHTFLKLPPEGFGTVLTVDNRLIPFRVQSVRNETPESTKGARKFLHEYTYAVDGWVTSTECEKIKQVLSIDITVEDNEGYVNTVIVTENV